MTAMSTEGPSYEEGHLVVAAIRILEHREKRPPAIDEIGAFLSRSSEIAHLFVRGLEARGVVRVVQTPFETHVEIIDHLALETLERGERSSGFGEALDEFEEKKRKQKEDMEAFFASGGVDKKKKEELDKLSDAFRKFQKQKRPDDDDQD